MAKRLLRKHKVAVRRGAFFGLVAPFLALPIGLNYSPEIANLLIFPMMPVMLFSGHYLGELTSNPLWGILSFLSSMVFWAIIFLVVAAIYAKWRRKRTHKG